MGAFLLSCQSTDNLCDGLCRLELVMFKVTEKRLSPAELSSFIVSMYVDCCRDVLFLMIVLEIKRVVL